jgi:hypothetical protein
MPRIKRIPGPYRFFFTSFDCNEPPHVHVERERKTCKFWLEPLGLARNHGFNARRVEHYSTDYSNASLHHYRGLE